VADPVLLTDLGVWLGGYDISGSGNACRFTLKSADVKDCRWGDVVDCVYPGAVTPDVSLSGYYDASTTGAADPVIAARALAATQASWPLTLCPPLAPSAAAGADGNVCYTITGAEFGYDLGAGFGESLPYTLVRKPRSGGSVARQRILLAKASRSATANGTGRQLGAISATQRMVAVLHVFAVDGGTWTVTIESDDNSNFTSATTRLTFTGATDITREVLTLAGPITDTHWRAVLTETAAGTTCTLAAAAGIIPA
jgi:hypothetical protein